MKKTMLLLLLFALTGFVNANPPDTLQYEVVSVTPSFSSPSPLPNILPIDLAIVSRVVGDINGFTKSDITSISLDLSTTKAILLSDTSQNLKTIVLTQIADSAAAYITNKYPPIIN